jgi:hypothetical protein
MEKEKWTTALACESNRPFHKQLVGNSGKSNQTAVFALTLLWTCKCTATNKELPSLCSQNSLTSLTSQAHLFLSFSKTAPLKRRTTTRMLVATIHTVCDMLLPMCAA